MPVPTLDRETRLWQDGYAAIAGIDEAGRGALAGPVVAAAVVLPTGTALADPWTAVRDSKELTHHARQTLALAIKQAALTWGIGAVSALRIDEIGIAAATRQAMINAVRALGVLPDYLLIDWVKLSTLNIHQESFAKADQLSVTVAAASILAKEHRDRLMIDLDSDHPRYGFVNHKGYGTQPHRRAIQEYGPCSEHRHSFSPISQNRPTLFEHGTVASAPHEPTMGQAQDD
jgi:ribonuclease HII